MAIQKTAAGKVDKRTKEYKEMVARARKRAQLKRKQLAKLPLRSLLRQGVVKMAILTNAPKRVKKQQHAWQQLAKRKAA